MDFEERKELVYQLQATIADDLPVYALYHPRRWAIYNPGKLDTWFYTKNGIAHGIPYELNKLVFIGAEAPATPMATTATATATEYIESFLYPIVASKISYARATNNRYNLGGDGDGGNGR